MAADDRPGSAPHRLRRAALVLAPIAVGALVVFALSRLGLHRIGHALITASPGWAAVALALMALSLVLRSVSWHAMLRAALPGTRIDWAPVVRATMIGVMTSAVFPGRLGEPTRVVVLARRLEGPNRRLIPIVAGTVFSQTLVNLLALVILAAITFTSVPLPSGHLAGAATALVVPLVICLLVLAGPRLLSAAGRSRRPRVALAAKTVRRLLVLARRGLVVFARPRFGVPAVGAQLAAWALQWLSCYAVLLALGLTSNAGLAAAAAVLLAVNISAVLPATPANVGFFQGACLLVLAAYGVGAGAALAYGIILQAVEVVTALALGIPALLGEGLSWRDIRSAREDAATVESVEAQAAEPTDLPGIRPSAEPASSTRAPDVESTL
ncbi:MAG TPA: lysylphosphatidylglycerol synthase transmembrane domain-containing protein [Solirubrobacteraceae bacterium]|nr:lysylphosphatidylglycerol synthase transmembrane domain-containing protein [Solirubrobacteraceae bacterium]